MRNLVLEEIVTVIVSHAEEVYHDLEALIWAPWLRFDAATLARQAEIFPDGQIILYDEQGKPLAALSANRVEWNGNKDNLTSWDDIAGKNSTYADTYVPQGNTYVLMSMSVRKEAKGSGLSAKILDQVNQYAREQRLEHVIGDFRPSEFGQYKAQTGNFHFEEYCSLTREDGQPIDRWLRVVARRGMQPLKADRRAMVIEANLEELEAFRVEHTPNQWWRVEDQAQIQYLIDWHNPRNELEQIGEVWECAETGTWYIDCVHQKAVYIESNLWGEIPIRS